MMKICISIAEKTMDEALAASKRAAEKKPDLIEIRFDLMASLPDDLRGFRDVPVPKIATLRSASQGGGFRGGDREKAALLRRAIKAGFAVVDLEIDSPLLARAGRDFRGAEIICSYHNLEFAPDVSKIIEILVVGAARGHVAKAAFKVNTVRDLLSIVEAATAFASSEEEFVLIGMGELGELTRIRAASMKCSFTYASLEPGKETAPGQIDFDTLRGLGDEPLVTGIAGHPLGHTLSPGMHNAAFKELGIAGRYVVLPTKSEELEDVLDLTVELNLRGFNVTIPHKESIVPLLDRLDDAARQAKAVNTVVNQGGELVGMNTDVHGVAKTFEKAGVQAKGKRVLIVGAGGAARACVSYLSPLGARISVVNRTRARAEVLANDFKGVQILERSEAEKAPFDVVINCTPLGMKGFPDEMPISAMVLRPGQFVFDTVYNPSMTGFLAEAQRRGAVVESGMEMLIQQAVRSFEIWTGRAPPYELMAAAAREAMG